VGGNGTLQTTDLATAKEWSQIYVKSGKIPASMKLNYNCPDSEKSGSGKGSCGGSDKGSSTTNQVKSDKISNRYDKKTLGQTVKSGLTAAANAEPGPEELKRVKELGSKLESKGLVPGTPLFEKNAKDYNDKLNIKLKKEASISESDGRKLVLDAYDSGISIEELSNPDNIDKQLDQAMDDAIESGFLEDWEGTNYSSKGPKGRFEKAWRKGYNKALLQLQKQKQNSQFKQLQNINGNTMTEEEFIAPETDVSETVQKLNADFEQKLNERDAKIAELETQLGDLVQKQNAAEEALVAERAKQDFEAFAQKLNGKARADAQNHYEGFKAEGWSYFNDKNLLNVEIPKMNARGIGAGEGDNASGLQAARDMFKKAQKERFSKRV
jgi:hypothetical protein